MSRPRKIPAAELAALLDTKPTMVDRWRRDGKLYRPGGGDVVARDSRLPHEPRLYWSDTKTSAQRRKQAPAGQNQETER